MAEVDTGVMRVDRGALLLAYDDQLRAESETLSAIDVVRFGPLLLVTFTGGRGFVTYRDLAGAGPSQIKSLVSEAVGYYQNNPSIEQVEWKTRGHDVAPGLHEALVDAGFTPEEPESVMIGQARSLAAEVSLPDGVILRRIEDADDVRAMSYMTDEAFGDPVSEQRVNDLLRRLACSDGMELWVAETDGRVVSAGRLEPVAGSDFAGIWGGATLKPWRGRGIYRALTAARARSALALGKTLIHSDSTEFSRPILERSGLIKVSTTTPYTWTRPSN